MHSMMMYYRDEMILDKGENEDEQEKKEIQGTL